MSVPPLSPSHTSFLLGRWRGRGGRAVEPPPKFSVRGGLTGSQFLEGGFMGNRVTFFREDCSLYIKNKLKSEILNEKKSL